MWVSSGPQSSQLTHWAVPQEQDLKAPALPHMGNGTGTGLALHFFSAGTNLLLPKTQMCVWEHSRVQTNTNKSVFLWAQLPLWMLCLRITFLAGLGVTVTRDQGLEHSSLHTHLTQRHSGSITIPLPCAATLPAHPAALGCPGRNVLKSAEFSESRKKRERIIPYF